VLFLDADDTALPPLGDLVRNLNGQAFDVALFAHTDSRRIAKGSDGPDEALDRALWADIAPGLMPRPMAPDEAQALCRISNYPWNKIWRRDFLTDAQVRATEIPLHNDIAPHWAAFVSSRRILVSDARCVLHTVAPRTAQLSNRRDAGRLHLFEALDAVLDRFQRDAERRPESTTYLGPFLDFSLRLCEWAESRLQDPQAVQELRRLKQTFLHRVAALPSPLAEALDAALTQEPALAGRVLAAMEDT
jgi:hypothetical protein